METTPSRPYATAIATLGTSHLEPYLAAWQQSLRTPNTQQLYRRLVERFFSDPRIAESTGGDPRRVEPAHVYLFANTANARTGEETSPSTRNVRMAALSSFFSWLQAMRLVQDNPATGLKRPRGEPPAPKGLDSAELRRLLAAIPESELGARDRAAVLVMVLAGLRRAEALGLRRGDLEEKDGTTYYRARVKGGRERFRELPAPALDAIRSYWHRRGAALDELADDERLLPVSDSRFYRRLATYADAAGLPHVSPHGLRHSAAKLRRQSGASLEDVQELLGHKSVATTAHYLRRMEGAKDDGWQAVAAALELDGTGQAEEAQWIP